jgi:hypothetical protein
MRRRAISSRMVSATCRLCSAESCLSGVGIITPANPAILADAQTSTKPHKATPPAARRNGRRLNNADHYARGKAFRFAELAAAKTPFGSEKNDHLR